jgi:hypothetical protein
MFRELREKHLNCGVPASGSLCRLDMLIIVFQDMKSQGGYSTTK